MKERPGRDAGPVASPGLDAGVGPRACVRRDAGPRACVRRDTGPLARGVAATTARAVAATLALALAACGTDGPSCPNDLPAACPDPAPTWASGAGAVIETRCAGCHQPGGRAPEKPLTTYDEVHALRRSVLTQVYACRMPPPADEPPLTDAERATLLAWLVCGAPRD